MAIYKTRDLQDRLCEIAKDGYLYVDITEIDADDEFPTSLSFDALAPYESTDYETVESLELDLEDEFPPVTFHATDLCHEIGFTYEEISTIHHAVVNALEYFKSCEKDPTYSKEVVRDIKSSAVKCRNLQAKLVKFLNQVSPKQS